MTMDVTHWTVLLVGLVAAATDLRARRIPNLLTFGCALAAVVFYVVTSGLSGLGFTFLGWTTGVVLFLPFFALGGMGAGDVKLLAGLGAWLGAQETLWLAIHASIAGGILALAVALFHGYLRQALRNLRLMLTHWRVMGVQPVPQLTLDCARGPRLPYALPILAGLVITLWLR